MKNFFLLVVAIIISTICASAQGLAAIKSNLAYGAVALAPNLGVELGISPQSTIDFSVGYNGWKREGTLDANKKLAHLIIQPEYRYYLCERFSGHFFGAHALFAQYNISEHNLPLIFGKGSKDYRFKGNGFGLGISYGYQILLSRRLNLELQLGVGYVRLHYDRFESYKCAPLIGTENRNYFGPTRAGISISYIIN